MLIYAGHIYIYIIPFCWLFLTGYKLHVIDTNELWLTRDKLKYELKLISH